MNGTVSLDSFQLIIGGYLIYVAIKGHGTLYNFFDLPKKAQQRIITPLRIVYAICGLIALCEAGLYMWQGSVNYAHISPETLNIIGTVMTSSIVVILAVVFIVLRRLANGK